MEEIDSTRAFFTTKAKLLIVMGVSGSGKSTLANMLAQKLQYQYLDADDFHTEEAKNTMAQGKPLNDAMRAPWIDAMLKFFILNQEGNKSYVLAYSGLKKHHRELFRGLPYDLHFIYLSGHQALIAKRLSQRNNHFFDASLLDSQFSALEEPSHKELQQDMLKVNIDDTLVNQEAYVLEHLLLKAFLNTSN